MKKLAYFLVALLVNENAQAIAPETIKTSDITKKNTYIRDGLMIGGSPEVDSVVVKDIRRSSNSQFERAVIDLGTIQNGEVTHLKRPPYYQVNMNSEERQITVTLWGTPKLEFTPKKVLDSFKHSSIIRNVMLYPRLEDQLWTFALDLKTDATVEVFELSNPARIAIDIRSTNKSSAARR